MEAACVNETRSERAILVVDDEQSIRHALSGILTDEGYEVHFAADGEEALEMVSRHKLAPSPIGHMAAWYGWFNRLTRD